MVCQNFRWSQTNKHKTKQKQKINKQTKNKSKKKKKTKTKNKKTTDFFIPNVTKETRLSISFLLTHRLTVKFFTWFVESDLGQHDSSFLVCAWAFCLGWSYPDHLHVSTWNYQLCKQTVHHLIALSFFFMFHNFNHIYVKKVQCQWQIVAETGVKKDSCL